MKDISEFKVGDIIEYVHNDFYYRVEDFNWAIKNRKRQIISSTCTNLEKGSEVVITWHKNKSFKLYEGDRFK